MNVLLLGSGGREHAFAWKIAQSPLLQQLYVAPGNAGTSHCATNISLSLDDFESIGNFSLNKKIDLIIVGPEAPLVAGIVDYFREKPALSKIGIIGSEKRGAMLEGSKKFAKDFMLKNNIPTAKALSVTKENIAEGFTFLESQNAPFVLKADGLAAGKGVIITSDLKEAKAALQKMLNGQFGAASESVLIEQFLEGIELSVFVLTDGENYVILPEAKDYKRIGEADKGLNTGGMGAVSPVPFADVSFLDKVEKQVIIPTIEGLKAEKIDYVGFIFIGLMNVEGEPFVIEYNVRMGDPETEVVIPRLKTDLLELFKQTSAKQLKNVKLDIDPRTATTVMLVSGGYPESYEKGKIIKNLEKLENILPFHAGTTLDSNGNMVTSGGRVLALTGLGNSISEALEFSNIAAETIEFEKKNYRKDIGFDLV